MCVADDDSSVGNCETENAGGRPVLCLDGRTPGRPTRTGEESRVQGEWKYTDRCARCKGGGSLGRLRLRLHLSQRGENGWKRIRCLPRDFVCVKVSMDPTELSPELKSRASFRWCHSVTDLQIGVRIQRQAQLTARFYQCRSPTVQHDGTIQYWRLEYGMNALQG
jgi:hypothetical protein